MATSALLLKTHPLPHLLFFTVLRFIPSEQLALCERVSRRWFAFIDERVWQEKCKDEGAVYKLPTSSTLVPKLFYKTQFAALWQNAFGPQKWKTFFGKEVTCVPRFPPSFFTTALKGQVTLLVEGITLKEIARFGVANGAGFLEGLENCTSWIVEDHKDKALTLACRWVMLGECQPTLAQQECVRLPSLMEAAASLITYHTATQKFLWQGLIPCLEGYTNVDDRFYPVLVGAETTALPYLKISSARETPTQPLFVLSNQSAQSLLADSARSTKKKKSSCTIL